MIGNEQFSSKSILGQGKLTPLLSANINVLSAFRRSPPAGNTLTSHWGGKRKHANVTLGRKAEAGAERPLWKAESSAVDLPGPINIKKFCEYIPRVGVEQYFKRMI
jgi:hypothetical protein